VNKDSDEESSDKRLSGYSLKDIGNLDTTDLKSKVFTFDKRMCKSDLTKLTDKDINLSDDKFNESLS
jgi:hypothetical protein